MASPPAGGAKVDGRSVSGGGSPRRGGLIPGSQLLALAMWNVTSLIGKEPELESEIEKNPAKYSQPHLNA